jgi:hypothetical protein
MLESIFSPNFANASTPIPVILFSLMLSVAVGQLIAWIYVWTHRSPSYSKTFSASLVVLPVIVALMMILMSGNTAIAFGLLAVFAVVRFRNVLKDTRDTTFILWAIVQGMGVGTLHFAESLCGLAVIGPVMVYLWLSDFGHRNYFDAMLSVDIGHDGQSPDQILTPILTRHASRWKQTGNQHLTQSGTSIAFKLLLRNPDRSDELRNELLKLNEIQQISLFVNEDQAES